MDLIEIVENTEEDKNKFHDQGWGRSEVEVTIEQIEALLNGKCLGYFDGEYTAVFTLK